MSHLYGAILKPSHTDRFTDWWTSSLQDTLVSHSLPQASEQVKTIHDTSGLGLQTEFDFFGQDSASLKMSKDTSASDSAKSLENWKALVIKARGEYSLRVKSARLTKEKGCSSWPTANARDWKDGSAECNQRAMDAGHQVTLARAATCWPTPCAMEAEKAGLFDKGQMGQSLSAMANRGELSNWPTPDASNHRDGAVLRTDNNLEQGGFHGVSLHHAMTKYGQAAPANPSTDGSRQGLSWPTPQTMDTLPVRPVEEFAETNKTRGGRKNRKALSNLREAVHSPVYQASWRTPQANEAGARVETLYTKDGQPARPGERAYRKTPDGRMVLQSQTINQQVEMVQNWATPIMGDSHLASTPEVAQKRIEEGKVTLSRQTAAWATPQLQDGHNINQDSTTHKTIPAQLTKMNMAGKLNPRWVETLMGLPVGWVMPSCKSPVTIELTSCASSATESCQQQQSELF